MLVSTQQLRALEERAAARRRINRRLIRPDLDPDSGEPLVDAPASPGEQRRARVQAQREAQDVARSWLMLQPLPPLPDAVTGAVPKGRPRREPPLGSVAVRCLDLLAHGARPRQVQGILSISRNAFDYHLREACRTLAAADRKEALAAWRARAPKHDHHAYEEDLAALERLRSQHQGQGGDAGRARAGLG